MITYRYDGQGRKAEIYKNTTLEKVFLYQSQLRPVAEMDGSGNLVARYVWGQKANTPEYMIKNNNTYRIITDPRGSVRLVVDTTTGSVAQRIDYDEWGQIISDTNPGFQVFGYAGGIYDPETGLTEFGARHYDAETGRWVSKDPILFGGGDTNLYGYVLQDPVNFVDPNGKNPVAIAIGLGALAGAAGNLIGSYMAGTLNACNFTQTAAMGALGGAAAVVAAGTSAIAATTGGVAAILGAPVGSGLIGTGAGMAASTGLNFFFGFPGSSSSGNNKCGCD